MSGAARVISIGTTLVAVPLLLRYLGAERYGIWVTLASATALLAFADFGLGNGLMNLVARSFGRSDEHEAAAAISSAFFLLTAVALAFGFVFLLIYPSVQWDRVVNAPRSTAGEVGPAAFAFVITFLIGLPLSVVPRVFFGYQQGARAALFSAAGSALGLVAILLAIRAGLGLAWLVLAASVPPILGPILGFFDLFVRRSRELRPRVALVSHRMVAILIRTGVLFLILQVAASLAFQSGIVIAAHAIGPSAAADLSVLQRLFFLGPTLTALALTPLWPAYGEAIVRGDSAWIRRTLRRSIRATFIFCAGTAIVLGLFADAILQVWVGGEVHATPAVVAGLAVWAVIGPTFNAVGMLFNAAGLLAFQASTASIMAIASIGLSIAGANTFGLAGIAWGTVLAYCAFSALPTVAYLPRLLDRVAPLHAATPK